MSSFLPTASLRRPTLPALVARLVLLLLEALVVVATTVALLLSLLLILLSPVEIVGSGPSCLSMAQSDMAISCNDSFLLARDVSSWLRYYHYSVV